MYYISCQFKTIRGVVTNKLVHKWNDICCITLQLGFYIWQNILFNAKIPIRYIEINKRKGILNLKICFSTIQSCQ